MHVGNEAVYGSGLASVYVTTLYENGNMSADLLWRPVRSSSTTLLVEDTQVAFITLSAGSLVHLASDLMMNDTTRPHFLALVSTAVLQRLPHAHMFSLVRPCASRDRCRLLHTHTHGTRVSDLAEIGINRHRRWHRWSKSATISRGRS